jgi:anthranilate synthase
MTTEGRRTEIAPEPFKPADRVPPRGDHTPGEYAELVKRPRRVSARGDLFEVVPGQTFFERCETGRRRSAGG